MKGYVLTVERVIRATPEAIFDVLSDASKHPLIDGSGMLQGSVEQTPERLDAGVDLRDGHEVGDVVLDVQQGGRVRRQSQYRLADRPRPGAGARVLAGTDLALRARSGRRRDHGSARAGTSPPTTSGSSSSSGTSTGTRPDGTWNAPWPGWMRWWPPSRPDRPTARAGPVTPWWRCPRRPG